MAASRKWPPIRPQGGLGDVFSGPYDTIHRDSRTHACAAQWLRAIGALSDLLGSLRRRVGIRKPKTCYVKNTFFHFGTVLLKARKRWLMGSGLVACRLLARGHVDLGNDTPMPSKPL